jgi:hypothetical protein
MRERSEEGNGLVNFTETVLGKLFANFKVRSRESRRLHHKIFPIQSRDGESSGDLNKTSLTHKFDVAEMDNNLSMHWDNK